MSRDRLIFKRKHKFPVRKINNVFVTRSNSAMLEHSGIFIGKQKHAFLQLIIIDANYRCIALLSCLPVSLSTDTVKEMVHTMTIIFILICIYKSETFLCN